MPQVTRQYAPRQCNVYQDSRRTGWSSARSAAKPMILPLSTSARLCGMFNRISAVGGSAVPACKTSRQALGEQ